MDQIWNLISGRILNPCNLCKTGFYLHKRTDLPSVVLVFWFLMYCCHTCWSPAADWLTGGAVSELPYRLWTKWASANTLGAERARRSSISRQERLADLLTHSLIFTDTQSNRNEHTHTHTPTYRQSDTLCYTPVFFTLTDLSLVCYLPFIFHPPRSSVLPSFLPLLSTPLLLL